MRTGNGNYIRFGRFEIRTTSFWLSVLVSILIFLTCIYAIDAYFRYAQSMKPALLEKPKNP